MIPETHPRKGGPKPTDLVGMRFGRLVVVAEGPRRVSASGRSHFRTLVCRCDCGTEKTIIKNNLTTSRSDRTISCGCFHREDVAKYARRVSDENAVDRALRSVYNGYKCKAKKIGVPFCLTYDKFVSVVSMCCHYCGSPPSNTAKFDGWYGDTEKRFFVRKAYSGIDRIVGDSGYVDENVVPCCIRCNRAKNAMTTDEFLGWVVSVFDHSCRISEGMVA